MDILAAVMIALTVVFVFWMFAVILKPESVKLNSEDGNKSISDKLFKQDPEILAQRLGIALDKYRFNCNIVGIQPKIQAIILARIASIIILTLGILLAIVANNLYIRIVLIVVVLTAAALTFIAPTASVAGKAQSKKDQFESEIPRFLDLLQTALKINLPIASAIKITAESIPGILSTELLKALIITEVGNTSWQNALYDIAQKYEVDSFSDFVLDIVTAYQKGADIIDSIERQSRDLKTTSLLKAKENAAKATSMILLPVVFFKMLPLLAILFIPIIIQVMESM